MSASPGKIEAVLFDVGGTLIHPDYEIVREVLAESGLEKTTAEIRSTELQAKIAVQEAEAITPWRALFGGWFKALGAEEADLPDLFERLWQCHRKQNLWSGVEPETLDTLRALTEKNFRLGVISNSNGKVKELLESAGLASYFEVIVDSQVVGIRKPEPAIFELALSALDVRPDRAIYIGDLYKIDILGAINAGITAVLFDPQDHHDSSDCIRINRLSQVLNLVNGK